MSHQCQASVKSNKINAEVEIHGFPGLLITCFSVPVGTMSLPPLIYLVWLSEPHATGLRYKQPVYELPEHRDDLGGKRPVGLHVRNFPGITEKELEAWTLKCCKKENLFIPP